MNCPERVRFGLYSADREAYSCGLGAWSPWAADARLWDTPEEAHEYRRLVLRLDDTTDATRRGCYLVHVTA